MVTLRGIGRRVGAAWSSLAGSAPPLPSPAPPPPSPREWWELLPFPSHRIRLIGDLYTSPDGVDAAHDLRTDVVIEHIGGSLLGRSVVDLGCLEGAFAIEFARRGAARVVGVEAREVSVRRCNLACELIGLENVEFKVGDVTEELTASPGRFDVVFASGIVYHLADPAAFLRLARQACTGIALIDTHVADPLTIFKDCSPEIVEHVSGGRTYRGRTFTEFDLAAHEADRSRMLWAAWENPVSFWPLEADLVRMMHDAGFRDVTKIDTSDAGQRWRVDPRSRVMYVCFV